MRRIAEWDDDLFEQACVLNEPTEIALMFADYIDPSLYGVKDAKIVMNSLTLHKFMKEHGLVGRVKYISTGPDSMVTIEEGASNG